MFYSFQHSTFELFFASIKKRKYPMKRVFCLLLTSIFCICGCSGFVPDGIEDLGGVTFHTIVISPGESNTIGKEGGKISITLTLQDIEGKTNPNQLKNEFFTESYNLDASFVRLEERIQIDDRTVRYVFSFDENSSGAERVIGTRVVDTTYVYKNIHVAAGAFSIRQLAN